ARVVGVVAQQRESGLGCLRHAQVLGQLPPAFVGEVLDKLLGLGPPVNLRRGGVAVAGPVPGPPPRRPAPGGWSMGDPAVAPAAISVVKLGVAFSAVDVPHRVTLAFTQVHEVGLLAFTPAAKDQTVLADGAFVVTAADRARTAA